MPQPSLRNPRLVIITLSLVIVAFFGLHRMGLLRPIEALGSQIATPIQLGLAAFSNSLRSLFGSLGSVRTLREDNERLREELAKTQVELEQRTLDQGEAAEIDRAVALLGERSYDGVPARVVGRSPDPTFQLYLVNRGRVDGIVRGAPVIRSDGVIVGKILEVEEHTARFIVLTDPHTQLAARVENEPQTPGIITGEHGLTLRMELLAKSDPVQVGQPVVTSGVEEGIPAGLVIGKITSIESLPGDLFQTATIEPALDVRAFSVVTILTLDHA